MSLAPIAPAPPPPPPPPPPPTGGSSNDKTIDTTPVVSKKDKKEKRERQTTETKSLHLGKGQAKQARVEGKGKGKERDVNRVSGETGGVRLSSLEEDRMAAGRSRIQSAGGEWKFQAGGTESTLAALTAAATAAASGDAASALLTAPDLNAANTLIRLLNSHLYGTAPVRPPPTPSPHQPLHPNPTNETQNEVESFQGGTAGVCGVRNQAVDDDDEPTATDTIDEAPRLTRWITGICDATLLRSSLEQLPAVAQAFRLASSNAINAIANVTHAQATLDTFNPTPPSILIVHEGKAYTKELISAFNSTEANSNKRRSFKNRIEAVLGGINIFHMQVAEEDAALLLSLAKDPADIENPGVAGPERFVERGPHMVKMLRDAATITPKLLRLAAITPSMVHAFASDLPIIQVRHIAVPEINPLQPSLPDLPLELKNSLLGRGRIADVRLYEWRGLRSSATIFEAGALYCLELLRVSQLATLVLTNLKRMLTHDDSARTKIGIQSISRSLVWYATTTENKIEPKIVSMERLHTSTLLEVFGARPPHPSSYIKPLPHPIISGDIPNTMQKDAALAAYKAVWQAYCRASTILNSLERFTDRKVEVWDITTNSPVEREVSVTELLSAEGHHEGYPSISRVSGRKRAGVFKWIPVASEEWDKRLLRLKSEQQATLA